jgi:hypothetical protein
MTETDLQLGGGYVYQWECAILLALNYFLEPVRYNPTLFDLVANFLGQVEEMHLEGEDRETGIDLEDINLVGGDRRILIQVKTKQAEGERWTPADPLLLKALYRFYDSCFFAQQPEDTRFVFLTNRPFNPDLVRVKEAIKAGALDGCDEVDALCRHLTRYAKKERKATPDPDHLRQVLARTALVEYLGVDEVKANVQKSLQALGRQDWRQACDSLFAHFSRQSTRVGGGAVTRASVVEVLGVPQEEALPAPSISIDTGGGAVVIGNVITREFTGRDRGPQPAPAPVPPARPKLPAKDDPLTLIAAALQARRLLLVWADLPFPPADRPPTNLARAISRWQAEAQALPTLALPLAELPPCSILSLDPSDRIERAFRQANVSLNALQARSDVVAPGRHNLIKLGGDLASRQGLLFTWADVQAALNEPVKVHLLKEARSVARDGVVLVLADEPFERFWQLWKELIDIYTGNAKHLFALGPADARWPQGVKHLSVDVSGVLAQLTEINVPSSSSPHESLPLPQGVRDIEKKIDRLLAGQEGLRRGQAAIYQHLDNTQRETVEPILAYLRTVQLDDAETTRELRGTLDAIRRALINLQTHDLPELDKELRRTLEEVTEVLQADIDLRTGLELTVPLIPLLLSYKATLEAGGGLDLRQMWENLVDWTKKHSTS